MTRGPRWTMGCAALIGSLCVGACGPAVSADAEPTCRTSRCDERYAGPQLHEGWTECVTCDEATDTCEVELTDDDGAVFSSCKLCPSCDDQCGQEHNEDVAIYCTGSL